MSKKDINISNAFYMTPEEIVKYFESKNCKISFDWHEVYAEAHAKAFTVAKMTNADLLKDTQNMLTTAIKEGWSRQKFQKNASELFAKKGWTGFKEMTDTKTGETKKVELGTPRRIKKIFSCNMNSAYAVGRYKEQMEDVDFAPYFQYQCILDNRTRPEHKALHGKVFRYDDPIWQSIYPPNGWNCRCFVKSLSDRDLARKGLKVESSEGHLREISTIVGGEEKTITAYDFSVNGKDYTLKPDAGWDTNLGMHLDETLNKTLDEKISKINSAEIRKEFNLDVTAHDIYQEISKIENIDILTTNYKKYDKIIKSRTEFLEKLNKIYKKNSTQENYKNVLKAFNKYQKSINKQDIILGKYIDNVIKSINTRSKTPLVYGKVGKNLTAEATALKNDLEKLVKNIPTIKFKLQETKDKRSYQKNGTVYLYKFKNVQRTNQTRLTALHEAMHWLEEVETNIGQKSIEFLEKRTINDFEEKLSKLTGNKFYKNWEIAKKDNFFNPYCGKIYKNSQNQYYGTEILSMGLQELISNPIEFYKKDKEYFKFVIGILKGEY